MTFTDATPNDVGARVALVLRGRVIGRGSITYYDDEPKIGSGGWAFVRVRVDERGQEISLRQSYGRSGLSSSWEPRNNRVPIRGVRVVVEPPADAPSAPWPTRPVRPPGGWPKEKRAKSRKARRS